MSASLSEGYIRRSLTAAKQGDVDSLRKLTKLSSSRPDVFRRTLPLVAHHIQPDPPFPAPDVPCQDEVLAAASLACLKVGCQYWAKEQETIGVLTPYFHGQLKNLLRWIYSLVKTWLFELTDSDIQLRATETHLVDGSSLGVFRNDIADSVPGVLSTMMEYKVMDPARDDSLLGLSLAIMILVGLRDDDTKMLRSSMSIRGDLLSDDLSSSGRKPERWKLSSDHLLHSNRQLFAETIVPRMTQYSWQHPLDPTNEISAILITMMECTGIPDLIDACIEQAGMARIVTEILCRTVEFMKTGLARNAHIHCPPPDPSMVCITPHLLRLGSNQGGAPFIRMALDAGLYGGIWALRMLRIREEALGMTPFDRVDHVVSSLVETILPYVVYPSIFVPTRQFFGDSGRIRRDSEAPSRLKSLDASLKQLVAMFEYEAQLRRDYLREVHKATSLYSNPYKFCDNPLQCPSPGKATKLWRCTSCWSGYYCSRFCQDLMWGAGHRKECKSIAESISNGKTPWFLTIHDGHYFRRSMVPRFRHWRETQSLQARNMNTANKLIVMMDFTKFPVEVEFYNEDEWNKLDCEDGRPAKDVPFIMGKFPVAGGIGAAAGITARNVPWEEFMGL